MHGHGEVQGSFSEACYQGGSSSDRGQLTSDYFGKGGCRGEISTRTIRMEEELFQTT